uniref:Melanoregulin n=1 Tax=Leptobrachium leishanense TaxID=445787 RepID=A0A8C5PEE5_9ANUR
MILLPWFTSCWLCFCSNEQNLWSSPHDSSHTDASDDRMLQNWIQTRSHLEKDSEMRNFKDHMRIMNYHGPHTLKSLNYDIYTLRQARREHYCIATCCLSGFQKEAESLLTVTKKSTISNPKNIKRAMEFLLHLADDTSIFPTDWDLPERYLYVMDRLICLDAVDEFCYIACKKYPKTKMKTNSKITVIPFVRENKV